MNIKYPNLFARKPMLYRIKDNLIKIQAAQLQKNIFQIFANCGSVNKFSIGSNVKSKLFKQSQNFNEY